MAKTCGFCSEILHWPTIYSCYYCQKVYCDKHRLAENHECPKVMAAKHIEKDWLRKKGVNITTGKFSVVCKQCGYTTVYYDIEGANQMRIEHIKASGCPSKSVQLREDEEDKAEDAKTTELAADKMHNSDWMYECLDAAKRCIKTHHNFCDCDMETFFRTTRYSLYTQDDNPTAYAYISIIKGSSHFPIAIHPALSDDNARNRRMLNVVLVHELLHALHQDWEEDKIRYTEKLLANKCSHFDALQDLDRLGFSESMHF